MRGSVAFIRGLIHNNKYGDVKPKQWGTKNKSIIDLSSSFLRDKPLKINNSEIVVDGQT